MNSCGLEMRYFFYYLVTTNLVSQVSCCYGTVILQPGLSKCTRTFPLKTLEAAAAISIFLKLVLGSVVLDGLSS